MQFQKCIKALACLAFLSAHVVGAQTVKGGVYTFTNSNAVQVSAIVGTSNVNKLVLDVPSGACAKVYVGDSSSINPANGYGVIKAIFPSACNGPTAPLGLIIDSWSINDFIQNADGIATTDYWVIASNGAQVEWETVTTGTPAAKTLHPILSGYAYQGGPPATAGSGDSKVEINVIPGANWKVSVCAGVANYIDSCFYDMYPQYYLANGSLSTPTPSGWSIQSSTLNGLATDFVINTPNTNGSGTAFIGVYQYQ